MTDERIDIIDFLGGTISGAAGVVVGQPFDVAIVRVQTAGAVSISLSDCNVISFPCYLQGNSFSRNKDHLFCFYSKD